MDTSQTQSVSTEGADIVFQAMGDGPPLLMISGAGGSAHVYARIAPILAEHFRVITYDRRANARSGGNKTLPLDMAQQARDAVAVLQADGHAKATAFGNSGGANIALQMAADHPGAVERLFLHEPPAVSLLDDDPETQDFVQEVYRLSQTDGAGAAMKRFTSRMVGLDMSASRPGGLGRDEDLPFFFDKEYLNITLFEPNLAAIRAARVKTVVLVGKDSAGAYYARTSALVAAGLDTPVIEVPGNHLAFLIDPEPFAERLKQVLAQQV